MKFYNGSKVASWVGLVFVFCLFSCKNDTQPQTELSAAFSTDLKEIHIDKSIQFTDESIGSPTSWKWIFEGGTPAISSERNPEVTYKEEGLFAVSLEVSNANSTKTIKKDDLIKVTCPLKYCGPQFAAYTKTERIAYGVDQNQQELIIYQPYNDPKTKRKAVLIMGGGGFTSGSNLDYLEPLAINLAKYGIVVAVARYRVNTQWPAQSRLLYAQQDSRTAVRFLKKEASIYGIDTTKVFAGGYGAGAFSALFHAYVDMSDLSSAEQAAIDQIGGIEGYSQGNAGFSSDVVGVISLAGGMYVTLDPITKEDVPLFAVHGTADSETPYNKEQSTFGSKPISEKVAQVGLKSELYTIDGGDHSSARLKSDDYIFDLMAFIKEVTE